GHGRERNPGDEKDGPYPSNECPKESKHTTRPPWKAKQKKKEVGCALFLGMVQSQVTACRVPLLGRPGNLRSPIVACRAAKQGHTVWHLSGYHSCPSSEQLERMRP